MADHHEIFRSIGDKQLMLVETGVADGSASPTKCDPLAIGRWINFAIPETRERSIAYIHWTGM